MRVITKIHHAIDNIEFGVTDMAATQAFYEAAFGWRFNNYGPEYAGIAAPDGDGEAGGLDANRAPAPADHSSRSTQWTSTQRRRQ